MASEVSIWDQLLALAIIFLIPIVCYACLSIFLLLTWAKHIVITKKFELPKTQSNCEKCGVRFMKWDFNKIKLCSACQRAEEQEDHIKFLQYYYKDDPAFLKYIEETDPRP